MKVRLEDIIEAMEFAGMETEYYYDTNEYRIMKSSYTNFRREIIRMCWQGQSGEEVSLEDLRINCMT